MSGPASVIPYPHVNGKPIAKKKRSTSPFSAAPPMTISRNRPPKTARSFSRILRWRIRRTGRSERKANREKEPPHVAVQRGPADDDLPEPSPEDREELLADLALEDPPDRRDLHQELRRLFLEGRPQPLRVNLLDDERHGQDEPWADLAERLENDLGRGRLREKRDRAAGRERKQKLEGTAERVREREKGDDRVSRLQGHVVPREDDVREQAPVRKHHPFGETGRPRRVDDRRESLVRDSRELKALGRFLYATRFPSRHEDVGEASREALLPAMESPEIRQREDGRDVAQLFRVERGEEGVRHEEKDGVGVVHDVVDVVGAEIGKDR